MRSTFGRLALEFRAKRRMSQTVFAREVGIPLSRISSLEHQRLTISDDTVSRYIKVLDLSGDEAHKLREAARYSSSRVEVRRKNIPHDDLHAMLREFGDRISPSGLAKIKRVLHEELGPEVASLEYANNMSASKTKSRARKKGTARPPLSPEKFVEICLIAEKIRGAYFHETSRLDVPLFFELAAADDTSVDLDILESLPHYAEGSFAVIAGHSEGHTILVEENRFRYAGKGAYFQRHVLCHEYAHHVLHPKQLESTEGTYLPPQELGKLSANDLASGEAPENIIHVLIDTDMEVEAECFATMLIVPWRQFIKGTSPYYLQKDFGEQLQEVERYSRYFFQDAVQREFERQLWERDGSRPPPFIKPE